MRNEILAQLKAWSASEAVLRVFDMMYGDGGWTLVREDPDFHQRFIATLEWRSHRRSVGGVGGRRQHLAQGLRPDL
jgi:hypothetical protein